jgi:hypothetical protein
MKQLQFNGLKSVLVLGGNGVSSRLAHHLGRSVEGCRRELQWRHAVGPSLRRAQPSPGSLRRGKFVFIHTQRDVHLSACGPFNHDCLVIRWPLFRKPYEVAGGNRSRGRAPDLWTGPSTGARPKGPRLGRSDPPPLLAAPRRRTEGASSRQCSGSAPVGNGARRLPRRPPRRPIQAGATFRLLKAEAEAAEAEAAAAEAAAAAKTIPVTEVPAVATRHRGVVLRSRGRAPQGLWTGPSTGARPKGPRLGRSDPPRASAAAQGARWAEGSWLWYWARQRHCGGRLDRNSAMKGIAASTAVAVFVALFLVGLVAAVVLRVGAASALLGGVYRRQRPRRPRATLTTRRLDIHRQCRAMAWALVHPVELGTRFLLRKTSSEPPCYIYFVLCQVKSSYQSRNAKQVACKKRGPRRQQKKQRAARFLFYELLSIPSTGSR